MLWPSAEPFCHINNSLGGPQGPQSERDLKHYLHENQIDLGDLHQKIQMDQGDLHQGVKADQGNLHERVQADQGDLHQESRQARGPPPGKPGGSHLGY